MSKILVIDDDLTVQLVLKHALEKEGHSVALASDGLEGVNQALKLQPDLIICDWMMPRMTGLEVCEQVKTHAELSFTYFILLTIREEVPDRVKGLDMGADEYLPKPVDINELQARVRAGLRLRSLAQKLKEANQQLLARNELLESLSLTDSLTGLLNRRAMDQALPHIVRLVGTRDDQTRYRYLCLLVMDVDHFKQVNDNYGHSTGDLVLQAIAGRLQSNVRPGSLLYRYGGEEFICVTPGLNSETSGEYAEFLCRVIAAHPISVTPALTIPITISIGGAIASASNLVTGQDLLQQADKALYQAKRDGRNCVRMFGNWETL